MQYSNLEAQLLQNQGMNGNGCYVTNYSNIRGLKVLATDTNGWSGIGVYHGRKIYWHLDHGYTWTRESGLVLTRTPKYIMEVM